MAYSTKESLVCQLRCEHKTLESSPALPFRELLSEERILRALERAGVTYRERVFTPLVTIYAALSQVTSSSASSCRDAVCRVITDLAARGKKACSTDTSSYCTARARLSEEVLAELTQETGQELHQQAAPEWLWKDRNVASVERLPKRAAIFTIVKFLCDSGITPEEIAGKVPSRQNTMFRPAEGTLGTAEFLERMKAGEQGGGKRFEEHRFYCDDGELVQSGGRTYAFTNHWGGHGCISAIDNLIEGFPAYHISCTKSS